MIMEDPGERYLSCLYGSDHGVLLIGQRSVNLRKDSSVTARGEKTQVVPYLGRYHALASSVCMYVCMYTESKVSTSQQVALFATAVDQVHGQL